MWLRRIGLLACLSVPAVVAGVNRVAGGPTWVAAIGLALGGAGLYVRARRQERAPGFLLTLTALAFFVVLAAGARIVWLDVRGQPTTVRVEGMDVQHSKHRGRDRFEYCYWMSHPDGSAVHGEICRDSQDLYLGRPTTVLLDPGGLSAPETPDRVNDAAAWRYAALGTLALLIVLCMIEGGRPEPRPRRTRPPARVLNRADRRRAGRR